MIRLKFEEALKQQNKTAYWLHKESGITYATISDLIKCKRKGIDFNTLDAICRVLKCQPGDLLVFEEDDDKASKS